MSLRFHEGKKCPICKKKLHIINLFAPDESRCYCKDCHYGIYMGLGRIELILKGWKGTIFLDQRIPRICRYKMVLDSEIPCRRMKLEFNNSKEVFMEFGKKIKFEIKRYNVIINQKENNEKLLILKNKILVISKKKGV